MPNGLGSGGNAMFVRREFLAIAALVSLAGSVGAGEWPDRPVKIIYPYAAGSAGDTAARLIARRLTDALGRAVIVENRVGGDGVVGTDVVARSAADGHTLLWAITPQIAISPAMTKVPYDPKKAFVPISAVSTNRFALIVNSKVPARTVAEFVDYVRAQTHGLTYADGGAGSIGHLSMVLFLNRAGLNGTNVSYRGNMVALTDVVAGHVAAMFSLFGDALAQSENGSVRVIAVSSEQRATQLPDVPTIAESGYPGFRTMSWWGLMAPAGTPKPIVDRIAMEVGKATRDSTIINQLVNLGVDPLGNTPEQFAEMISADAQLWAEAVRLAGLQAN
jgi:tripartite-type tricarboxylate transporter receptor subunit TctC